ncbi:Monocarboxylate transporter 7 [Holothuria leucospilota]|uniref:Monocarboxylate transporter 7 n=1 Tax=Holothuria leucospilota TaxID=206669 RepID=A0A9Q1CQC0_HOLLE|nr:Monocarboxylate transporter 7 [Holothuria leucospilota]
MDLTWQQCQALVARCLYKFLLDGTLKAYGVIMEETVTSFQAQHYLIGCAFSLQTGIGYLIAPLASTFDRRVHPRIVASIGGFLAGLGFFGRAVLPSRNLWQLFACLSLSGVGFGLVNVITVISLKETFESAYPTAYSVTLLPSYIGIAVMPPLLEYLQREYGERIGMIVFGVLSWTLMLSGLFTPSGKTDSKDETEMTDIEILQTDQKGYDSTQGIQKQSQDADYGGLLNETTDIGDYTEKSKLLRNSATTKEGEANNIKMRESEKKGKLNKIIDAKRILKAWVLIVKNHPESLFLLFITILADYGFTSWSIFLVPYGEYLGLDSETAVWLSTLGGIAGLVGRFFCIFLFYIHRMKLPIGLLVPTLCVTSAYVISLFTNAFLALAVVSILSGFGLSVQACVVASWIHYCVCDDNFKTALYGFYVLAGMATLMGGIITGGIIDISGSYRVSFASLAILSFFQATAVLVWLFCPSVPSPEKEASSRKDKNTNCCSGNLLQ